MKITQKVSASLRLVVSSILVLFATAGIGQAQVSQTLYAQPTSPARDNYTGVLGCRFQVGSSNIIVSHLGYFDHNGDGGSGLAISHNVGLFNSTLSSPFVLGQVTVPAGSSPLYTNGFRWVALDPPLLLSSNTTYVLGGLAVSGDGDTFKDSFTPTWNTYFVGGTSAAGKDRNSAYSPGNATWPPTGFSLSGTNTTYGASCLGNFPVDQARAGVQTTNVSISAGQTISILGFASGQPPISYQWYSAPNTLLANQTNATLVIPNSAIGDSGTYYLTATNSIGGEQSANVTVLVTSFPVGISQQPTNLTVFANYSASFFMTATGSPPIYYQWSRNGISISGATSNRISFTAALTNNGDVYSCQASNFTSLTPYTATSSNATLTVLANLAQPQQILHGYNTNLTQNNFSGVIGGQFTVGNSPVTVTHLAYYAPANQYTDANDCNLTQSHRVGIFNAGGTTLLGYVTVPSGVSPVVNGYIWAPLNPPLVLSNNTQYLLAAETFSGVDPWGNSYTIPDLNPYFAVSCDATYWGAAWPGGGVSGAYAGQMYSAPNMAIFAPTTPSAYVSPTNVTQYAGFNATLTATVIGQAPVTVQWYKEPNIQQNGQTNLTLNLNNLGVGDSGNYYIIATNTTTTAFAQSADATVTVLADVGPTITNDIQSQNIYIHTTLQLAIGASGTPPLSYQWTFNANPIAGATNSTFTINDFSSADVGNYQVIVTNNYNQSSSSIAAVGIIIPAWGTYESAALRSSLLAYYRFSGVNSGNVATNEGSLGFAYNGTYEGGYSGVAGPTGSNFEPDNLAVSLDGSTADVLVPSFGNLSVSNCTIAAWVYDGGGQFDNSTIFYHRQSSIFGLSIGQTTNTSGEWIKYTWNNNFYNNFTGLVLPTNQWAFVAMVINPTNAAIYLQNGASMSSTNFAGSYPSQSFNGISYIGWDTAGSYTGRRWDGNIDEMMIFSDALSPTAINALYLGVPPTANLTIAPSGNNLVVTWPGGTLLEATNILGPWTPTINATNGTYTLTPSAAMKFYRVQLQ